MAAEAYWRSKSLTEMSEEEWESLCDGCGKCCLHKLEDEDDGAVYYTNVACRLLSEKDCRCLKYDDRLSLVEGCIDLKPEDIESFHWLPSTCAYRLISENKPLPDCHPLITGDSQSMHKAGLSVKNKTLPEGEVREEDYEECVVYWVD